MKGFIIANLLVVAVSASLLEEHASMFQGFKLEHGKAYLNQAEETKRFSIFRENIARIAAHNALYEAGLETYKQGINQFADMTQEEFNAMLNLQVSQKPLLNATPYVKKGIKVPESVDWREQGRVNPVRNQGNCGSCWAFAVVAATEAAFASKNGTLVSLSEQQLVDCTRTVNFGCDGGFLDQTFPYIEESGLQTQASYPYTGKDEKCKYNETNVVTKVSSYVSIEKDEEALYEAVGSVGPVAVAIDASFLNFYSSGIFADFWCSKTSLNHAVLVVGYGTENGKDYWIVRNSWGQSFGENGYFRMFRNTNSCGIAQDNVYPVIN